MKQKIKVAILGMGNMGKAHSNHLMQMEDVEIVAMCSSNSNNTKKYVEDNNLSVKIFENYYQMLEEVEINVLYVCLPPFAHDGQVEAAAKKGIHIFIEKPIAISVERATLMADAVKDNKVLSQVGYHMRFGGAVIKLKELIDSGEAGRPLLYTANYECNSLHTPWWIDVNKCGGQVFEQVIHLYDMAYYLLGTPDSVNGYTANLNHQDTKGYTVEDTSISAIRFKNGSLAGISGSNCAIPNQWNGFFKVICQNLVAEFKDHNNATFIYTTKDNKVIEISIPVDAGYEEDEYFISVIKGEKPEFAPISDGLIGLKMVSGVIESSKKDGNSIKI
jgi:predicted dehydrogenase